MVSIDGCSANTGLNIKVGVDVNFPLAEDSQGTGITLSGGYGGHGSVSKTVVVTP